MTQLVVFPNAATITITRLREALSTLDPTAEVHGRIPKERPDRFVYVARHGGPRQTVISDAAQLGIESFAQSATEAQTLAQLVRAVVNAMANTQQSGVQIYFVNEFSGPAELPDPVSNQARYVQSFQISMRGAAA